MVSVGEVGSGSGGLTRQGQHCMHQAMGRLDLSNTAWKESTGVPPGVAPGAPPGLGGASQHGQPPLDHEGNQEVEGLRPSSGGDRGQEPMQQPSHHVSQPNTRCKQVVTSAKGPKQGASGSGAVNNGQPHLHQPKCLRSKGMQWMSPSIAREGHGQQMEASSARGAGSGSRGLLQHTRQHSDPQGKQVASSAMAGSGSCSGGVSHHGQPPLYEAKNQGNPVVTSRTAMQEESIPQVPDRQRQETQEVEDGSHHVQTVRAKGQRGAVTQAKQEATAFLESLRKSEAQPSDIKERLKHHISELGQYKHQKGVTYLMVELMKYQHIRRQE